MFCFKCGTSIPDKAPACPQCGAAVSVAPPPAPSPSAAPAMAPSVPRVNLAAPGFPGPRQTDGKAIGSLVLGILSIFPFGLLAGIPAVILGHLSRKSIRESFGRLKGEGMALAGLIMGYLSLAAIPIILIIVAIAVPSLLRSRMLANESAAMSTVRTLNASQAAYSTTYPTPGYARDLATLGPGSATNCSPEAGGSAEHACLIDSVLGNQRCVAGSWCIKAGFKYSVTAECGTEGACTDYVIVAVPVQPGVSGNQSFCSTSDMIIRQRAAARVPASADECKLWAPVV